MIEKFENYWRNIEKKESKLNSFITLRKYEDIEKELKNNKKGRLNGIIFSIKDNIITKNIRTTAGSKILENFIPPYDATVIQKIKKEGGIIIGKSNMDEFACGSDGTNSAFGFTRNPYDLDRVPGGSSSGSAVNVSANFVDVSLGSDTGGSIRNPAAFNSIYGYKPTYGLISRFGLIDMAMSLDQIGILSRDLDLLIKTLDVIKGIDYKDATTFEYNISIENYVRKKKDKKYKLVYFKEFVDSIIDNDIKNKFFDKIEELRENNIEVYEISFKYVKYLVPTYYIIVFAEFSSAMQRYDGLKFGVRVDGNTLWDTIKKSRNLLGKEVKRRILLGGFVTSKGGYSKYYKKAIAVRKLIINELKKIFKNFDFIISPTMPTKPWKIGEINKPLDMYKMDILTVLPNLVGSPAISIPIDKFIGFQIIAYQKEDHNLLKFVYDYKYILKWQR